MQFAELSPGNNYLLYIDIVKCYAYTYLASLESQLKRDFARGLPGLKDR